MADEKMSLASAGSLSPDAPVPEQVPILPLRDTVPTTPLVLARAAGGRLTRRAEIFAAYCKELFGR